MPGKERIQSAHTELRVPEPIRRISSIGTFLESVDNHAVSLYEQRTPRVLSEKMRKVLTKGDFSGVSPAAPEYDELFNVAVDKAKIKRKLIRTTLREGENALGLTRTERTVLLATCDIGDQFDEINRQWRKDVIHGPDVDISDRHDYIYEVARKKTDDSIEVLSYAQAFPAPITEVGRIVTDLIDDLGSIPLPQGEEQVTNSALQEYFGAFRDALVSEDIDEHEALNKRLDKVWLRVPGRMQPIHGMETYADPSRKRINPEFNLAFKDDRHGDIGKEIVRTKEGLLSYLNDNFGNRESLQSSLAAIEASSGDAFAVLTSGRGVEVSYAGQNIPNRADVRLINGVKVFINMDTMKRGSQIQKGELVKVVGEEKADELYSDLGAIAKLRAIVGVASHEFAHNAFVSEETNKIVSPSADEDLEETKADMGSVAAAPDLLSERGRQLFTRGMFGWSVRMLAKRDNQSTRPYYHTGLIYLNLMHEAGLLQQDGDQFTYTDDLEHGRRFFEGVRRVFGELVDVYDTLDPNKASSFTTKYFEKTPIIESLHQKLGLPSAA